jgi:glycosyltransferase involved in cell wall biosynthesis
VVTTTGGSLPEIAGDAATLIEPGDHDALAAAIAKLAGDPAARQDAAAGPPASPGSAAPS